MQSVGADLPGFAVDSHYAYIRRWGGSTSSLARIPLDSAEVDGSPTLMRDLPLPAVDLVTTDSGLYWTNDNTELCFAPFDGGASPGDAGCGGGALFGSRPQGVGVSAGLALGGNLAFLVVYDTNAVWSMSLDGGGAPYAIQVDGVSPPLLAIASELFWSERAVDDAGATVFSQAASPGAFLREIAVAPSIAAFTVDDDYVYVATDTGWIFEVSRKTGVRSTLACDDQAPGFLRVDALYLYWAQRAGAGAVKKIAKS
jgi:hypothetical protein